MLIRSCGIRGLLMTLRACIVVPFYNHAKALPDTVKRLVPLRLPIFVVNDGSTAEAAEVARHLATVVDGLHVIDHKENRGKGAAVLTGLRVALNEGYSHAIQIDADGQHDAGDIPRFLAVAASRPDTVVLGLPEYDESIPRGRLVARYLTHVWIWIETLSFSIRDSMCGFRVYPLRTVVALADRVQLGSRMDFDPEILVRLYWAEVPMAIVPTRVIYPEGGSSHFRMWQDNWLITKMHTRLFFGMLRRLPELVLRHTRAPTKVGREGKAQ